jgi:hypothetical protein
MAAADGRQAFQAEVSGLFHIARWFAQEGGVVFTRVAQTEADGDQVNLTGGFPYLRPRLQFGHASLAVALSGRRRWAAAAAASSAASPTRSSATAPRPWSVYVGAYAHGFELVGEAPIDVVVPPAPRRRRVRAGPRRARSRSAIALELFRQRRPLRNDDDRASTDGFAGGRSSCRSPRRSSSEPRGRGSR